MQFNNKQNINKNEGQYNFDLSQNYPGYRG